MTTPLLWLTTRTRPSSATILTVVHCGWRLLKNGHFLPNICGMTVLVDSGTTEHCQDDDLLHLRVEGPVQGLSTADSTSDDCGHRQQVAIYVGLELKFPHRHYLRMDRPRPSNTASKHDYFRLKPRRLFCFRSNVGGHHHHRRRMLPPPAEECRRGVVTATARSLQSHLIWSGYWCSQRNFIAGTTPRFGISGASSSGTS